jgi:hypothetical protein
MANTYTKVSELSVIDLANYLRLTEIPVSDTTLLSSILEAAKSYVLTYTGRDEESADTFPEFTLAVLVLSEDLYDKRTYSVDKNEANKVVESILGMRSINLL